MEHSKFPVVPKISLWQHQLKGSWLNTNCLCVSMIFLSGRENPGGHGELTLLRKLMYHAALSMNKTQLQWANYLLSNTNHTY